MPPRKHDEPQLFHDIGIGDVEVVLEKGQRDQPAKLGESTSAPCGGCKRLTDVLLHIFLSGSHCTLAELHAELGCRVVHAPCRKVRDVVRCGLLVSLVTLW